MEFKSNPRKNEQQPDETPMMKGGKSSGRDDRDTMSQFGRDQQNMDEELKMPVNKDRVKASLKRI